MNSIPFIGNNPQVTAYTPMYEASASETGDTVAVDVLGNFKHAFEQKMTPTLTSAGAAQPLPAGVLTTQELTFFVPATVFHQGRTSRSAASH
jgi:hypothetical protein